MGSQCSFPGEVLSGGVGAKRMSLAANSIIIKFSIFWRGWLDNTITRTRDTDSGGGELLSAVKLVYGSAACHSGEHSH